MIWTLLSSVDRLLGLLSQTMGNLDQAAGHFEEALAFCRKAGYKPELAWSCCDYSDTLRERDAEGDRAKAKVLLDESLAISTELGMRPLMERVTERLDRIQAQPFSYRNTHYTWGPEFRWSLRRVRMLKQKSIFIGSSRRCA